MEGVEEKKQQLRLISISFSHLLYHMFTSASSAWEYNSNCSIFRSCFSVRGENLTDQQSVNDLQMPVADGYGGSFSVAICRHVVAGEIETDAEAKIEKNTKCDAGRGDTTRRRLFAPLRATRS